MSKKNGSGKKDTEKLYQVVWEERVLIEAHIWAKSPEDAKEIAALGDLDNLVDPIASFYDVVPDSYEVGEEMEEATKKDYKSGGNYCIEIHY